jgi:hypothetical protein
MILRSPTEDENAELRHAGMDGRHPGWQDASGDIHVVWIPALHAGMTQSSSCTNTDRGPPPLVGSFVVVSIFLFVAALQRQAALIPFKIDSRLPLFKV